MSFADIEYVSLRVLRKFVLSDEMLARFGRFLPFWRPSLNQTDPFWVIARYRPSFEAANVDLVGRRIAEIGVGRTNSTAYAFASLGARQVWAVEPFAIYDAEEDARQLEAVAKRSGIPADELRSRVTRLKNATDLPPASADLVLSHSVVEHVAELDGFFNALKPALTAEGEMLHVVDYRDHFFKYPYHFLKFAKGTWDAWLNPGDLPRWRLYDSLESLERTGWNARVLVQEEESAERAKVEGKVTAADFRIGHPQLFVTQAGILAKPRR